MNYCFIAAGKRADSAEKSRAERYSCDGNNPIQLRSSSVRGGRGGWRRKREAWEEEERERGSLALPPGLHHKCDEDVGGEGRGGTGDVCGVHEEEIQLNYTRFGCIFNHIASFPDVTVSLCEAESERGAAVSLPVLSCPPLAAHTAADQQHNTRQLCKELMWRHKQKQKNPVTRYLQRVLCYVAEMFVAMWTNKCHGNQAI